MTKLSAFAVALGYIGVATLIVAPTVLGAVMLVRLHRLQRTFESLATGLGQAMTELRRLMGGGPPTRDD